MSWGDYCQDADAARQAAEYASSDARSAQEYAEGVRSDLDALYETVSQLTEDVGELRTRLAAVAAVAAGGEQ